MSLSSTHTSLLLRLSPSSPDTPDLYPVEVTLDGAGSLTASATLQPDAFRALESRPWEYGKQLGQSLFGDSGLQRALAYARGKAELVEISLQIDAANLRDLLWERLIIVSGAEEIVFAASTAVALSRRIPSETAQLPPRDGPFRLFLVLSSPTELAAAGAGGRFQALDIPSEIASLKEAWDPLVKRGLMQVSVLARMPEQLAQDLAASGYRVFNKAATLDSLADVISGVDSLHLISHGKFKDGQASLLLENPEGGSAIVEEQSFLGRIGERSLRLVFLQACQSSAREPGHANVLSGLAPKMTTRAAGVVAMQDVVRVQDARRFAQEFYETLLNTGSAHRAANAGRRAIYRPDSAGWAIPTLFLGPKADPIWQPDAVLSAVQDFAEQLRQRREVTHPFPVEVIRQWPDVSSKMETSPPGPRVRVLEGVTAALFEPSEHRSPFVVIAGNYGRAKTAQLYWLYSHFANRVAEDGRLPFFAQISEFQATDDAPDVIIANAISRTFKKWDVDLPVRLLLPRLKQPHVLCLDSDQTADNRRRVTAFDTIRQFTDLEPNATAIVTVDEQVLGHIPALNARDPDKRVPVLLVQLLSPATVAQFLGGWGDECKPLLSAIQRANLFDLAGVPWLLAHLLRQAHRGDLSRSGVIARVVNANLSSCNMPSGVRRMVHDLLGRIAWSLQLSQGVHLDGARLYECMDQVRGRREIALEQLKSNALETKILAPSDEDGVRFSYPGFQSHWCAQYLLDQGSSFTRHLNDITATLGRRNRVRLWEDTLVLLAGLMNTPDRLIGSLLAGSSLGHGEHAFLAARCIHEAMLSGRPVAQEVVERVLDTLIWRSTPMKETSASVRIRATESLALLRHRDTIPHLISLAVERVRPTFKGTPAFELSGLRHAALQALLMMRDEVEKHVQEHPNDGATTPYASTAELIRAWGQIDSQRLREIFKTTPLESIPAVVAFALGTLGGSDNLQFLVQEITNPKASLDTQWSIADSLLLFNPTEVTERAITPMRAVPELHSQAAYLIGRLRVAAPDSPEMQFLAELLKQSPNIDTRGVALKALGRLGATDYREDCELMAAGRWDKVARRGSIAVPRKPNERTTLRVNAIETLRLIGTRDSLLALRDVRNWRPEGSADDRDSSQLIQLSYEVSEEIYWRVTGGLEGDFLDPVGEQP